MGKQKSKKPEPQLLSPAEIAEAQVEMGMVEAMDQALESDLGYWRGVYFVSGYGQVSGKVTQKDLDAFKAQLNPASKLEKFIAPTDVRAEHNARIQRKLNTR